MLLSKVKSEVVAINFSTMCVLLPQYAVERDSEVPNSPVKHSQQPSLQVES